MIKYLLESTFIIIGILILLINFFVVSNILPFIAPLLNVAGGLIAVLPPVLIFYARYKRGREIENQFVIFLMDLTEAINSGMTLPIALKHCANRDYMSLSPYVNNLVAQVDWGVPFKKSLQIFGRKTGSLPVQRSVNTIIQTYNVGGKISDTLSAVGKSLITINKIKKERSLSVHAQILTSYLIFFVFIFILVILQTFLIPALTVGGGMEVYTMPTLGSESLSEIYTQSFIYFIIVQGFFAGLATGKMAEGSIIAGFKHSILLVAIGYTIFSISVQFQISFF